MPRKSVVINYIPRVEEHIDELFVNRMGNDLLGDHLRNMLYSDNEAERNHVLNQFSERVDHHKITLFRVMLDDESLFLGRGLDDPSRVQKLADRMIVGGRRYSVILAQRNINITEENCRCVVTDMAILADMALSIHNNAHAVGFLSANDEPVTPIPNVEQYKASVLTQSNPPAKPNWFKRFMNKVFGAFSKEINDYNEYKQNYAAAEMEYFNLVNNVNAHMQVCRNVASDFVNNAAQVQQAQPAVGMNAAQLDAEEVEAQQEAPVAQQEAPAVQQEHNTAQREEAPMTQEEATAVHQTVQQTTAVKETSKDKSIGGK